MLSPTMPSVVPRQDQYSKAKKHGADPRAQRDVLDQEAPRALLVTDKPLYRPGQLMDMHALCLRSFVLSPSPTAN